MRIGYPCINRTLGLSTSRTFRLASYSEKRLKETIVLNLESLKKILEFNVEHGLLFFRIGSGLIPFASHPVCRFSWADHFSADFQAIGRYIQENGIRISMHPDQFTLINAQDDEIVLRSVREIDYHVKALDLMELDASHKVQIHVGGVYGHKEESLKRFVRNYGKLPARIKKRLVVENDERLYCLADCLQINQLTGAPVLFDVFHHAVFNQGEGLGRSLEEAGRTWREIDGRPMVDYSSQAFDKRPGAHTETIDLDDFRCFLGEKEAKGADVMLEIKDKEKSALKARKHISSLKDF